MGRKVVVVIRVSSDDENLIEAQINFMEDWANQNNLEIKQTIILQGNSSSWGFASHLKVAVSMASRVDCGIIACRNVYRVSRNPDAMTEFLDYANEKGVEFYPVEERRTTVVREMSKMERREEYIRLAGVGRESSILSSLRMHDRWSKEKEKLVEQVRPEENATEDEVVEPEKKKGKGAPWFTPGNPSKDRKKKTMKEQVSDLQLENSGLQNRIRELESENGMLRETVEELKKMMETLKDEITELKKEIYW
eukprot:TRINITY_DN8290_c0_g1_i1.p2 TRINITY_DN8290_c0_g1~~TRINITY_DN8290_c0_g1_i1.p2  ORF type:complete len:251 (-),score=58.18 TRINITY_DN8290_c0_g1_i1:19-771(-)